MQKSKKKLGWVGGGGEELLQRSVHIASDNTSYPWSVTCSFCVTVLISECIHISTLFPPQQRGRIVPSISPSMPLSTIISFSTKHTVQFFLIVREPSPQDELSSLENSASRHISRCKGTTGRGHDRTPQTFTTEARMKPDVNRRRPLAVCMLNSPTFIPN